MTILSHAGLLVENQGRQLICDPWLIGSCYWRSWWNYPPVAPDLIATLRPDWIYLTHIHWDHFQSASLKLFSFDTPILIPFDRHTRMRDDLQRIGFRDVRELRHARRTELAPGLAVTSYQFSPFSDSALAIEADGITILNANDAKFMGLPLGQILRRHPKIDFALRSHSSANARLTYRCLDAPEAEVDDTEGYSRAFCAFMLRVKPRYAVPFASNHCHLHRDTWAFNRHVTSPEVVARDFAAYQREHPFPTEVKVMTSGDSWDSAAGFSITPSPYITDRENQLAAYAAAKQPVLERTYAREARAHVGEAMARRFLLEIAATVPFFWRRRFRGHPVLFETTAGETRQGFVFDLWAKTVTEVDPAAADPMMMRVIIPANIFRMALVLRMFGHAAISKRLRWQARHADMGRLHLLEGLLSWYEHDTLPLSHLFTRRSIACFAPRWREVLLYLQLVLGMLRGRSLRRQEEALLGGYAVPAVPPSGGLTPQPR